MIKYIFIVIIFSSCIRKKTNSNFYVLNKPTYLEKVIVNDKFYKHIKLKKLNNDSLDLNYRVYKDSIFFLSNDFLIKKCFNEVFVGKTTDYKPFYINSSPCDSLRQLKNYFVLVETISSYEKNSSFVKISHKIPLEHSHANDQGYYKERSLLY